MNYAGLRTNMVVPLLTKYGKPMTIVRQATAPSGWVKSFDGGLGCYKWTNTETSEVVYVDPTTTPIPVTYATVGVEKPYLQDEIDGTVVVQGDRRFVVDGNAPILVGDSLQVDSATDLVRVQDLKKVSPALVNLAWIVHARG